MKYRTLLVLAMGLLIHAQSFAGEGRGHLGVYLEGLDDGIRQETAFEGQGVMISKVVADSGAAKAGLKSGDIITSLNGKDVTNSKDLVGYLQDYQVGETVTLGYFRDGAENQAKVVLGEKSMFKMKLPDAKKWIFTSGGPTAYMGIEMKDLNDQLAEYFGVKAGILVTRVVEDSPAAEAGLKAGDVITNFAGQPVETSKDLFKYLADFEEGQKVNVVVSRKGKPANFDLTLAAKDQVEGNVFHFYSDDDDETIFVHPEHLKNFEFPREALDIRIPEFEVQKMWKSGEDMEEFKAEMERMKKELEVLRKEIKELKTPK